MANYRIYHVWCGHLRIGRAYLFARWYAGEGYRMLSSIPGVKSVQTYARQFGLGPSELDVEIWMEIENYATYDRLDQDIVDNPARYAAWYEIEEFLEQRTSRVMGEFPGSVLLPERSESQGDHEPL